MQMKKITIGLIGIMALLVSCVGDSRTAPAAYTGNGDQTGQLYSQNETHPPRQSPQNPPMGTAGPKPTLSQADVTYLSQDGVDRKLDVYETGSGLGRSAALRPALIFIHGGGFVRGDKNEALQEARSDYYASQGYVVFAINYRLAPAYPYPAGVDDVKLAVRWVKSQAGTYRIDPERIGLIGHSAGGYYALMAALDPSPPTIGDPALTAYSGKVACAVIFYGISHLPSMIQEKRREHLFTQLMGRRYSEAPDLWEQASPINHVSANAPPIYLFHGTADTTVPVEQSRMLYQALKNAGRDAFLLELQGATHGWRPRSAHGMECNRVLPAFLDRYLKP